MTTLAGYSQAVADVQPRLDEIKASLEARS